MGFKSFDSRCGWTIGCQVYFHDWGQVFFFFFQAIHEDKVHKYPKFCIDVPLCP